MDVIEGILTRRGIGRVVPDQLPPKSDIERMLEAATRAPNHHLTEPWRFFVLTAGAREQLGNLFAEITRQQLQETGQEADPEKLEAERRKPLRAPVVIAVACVPQEGPKVVLEEELQATAAAIQNMMLVAHARGLGAQWRTGPFAYHPKVKAFFGLPKEASIAGFIYVGYPDTDPPAKPRTPYQEKTTWLGLQDW